MNLLKCGTPVKCGQGLGNYRIGLSHKPLMGMNLPDDSQWDETICDQALCQHPQCWASVYRIERGHPRIMGAPGRSPLDEDKLPMLTIVNISDSNLQAKRLTHRPLSHLPFRKTYSLLSRSSKLKSKHPSRPTSVPGKNGMSEIKFPKLSILNLNGTELPCSEVARNMVVVWIPKGVEKKERSAEKKPDISQRKAKEKSPRESQLPSHLPGTQDSKIPPILEKLMSQSAPVSAQLDGVPQDLLKESLLPDVDKAVTCPEMKIKLAMMKKNLPLEKPRPGSAISSKMFLTINRLTLQRRSLQQPEYWKKSQKQEGPLKKQSSREQYQWWRQQKPQKRKVKLTAKKEREEKPEALSDVQELEEFEKEVKSDSRIQKITSHTTLQDQESELKQSEKEGSSKLGFVSHLMMDESESYSNLNFISSLEGTDVSDTDYFQRGSNVMEMETDYPHREPSFTYLDTESLHRKSSLMKQEAQYSRRKSAPMVQQSSEVPVAGQQTTFTNRLKGLAEHSWKPELKLLRIIQATAEEEEESQHSRQSEESVEAQLRAPPGTAISWQDDWHI